MKDVVISEAMEDMDKDKDGFVTLQEYIGKGFLCCIVIIISSWNTGPL